jgi:hypothetical protein
MMKTKRNLRRSSRPILNSSRTSHVISSIKFSEIWTAISKNSGIKSIISLNRSPRSQVCCTLRCLSQKSVTSSRKSSLRFKSLQISTCPPILSTKLPRLISILVLQCSLLLSVLSWSPSTAGSTKDLIATSRIKSTKKTRKLSACNSNNYK